jgi:hypothetical protein
MKRERWWIHFKRKRADPIFGSQLRFAKKAAGIDVTRKSTGWNSSKVIDASRIRTVIKDLASRPSAHTESHPAAVGHNAQLDSPE